MKKAIRVLYRIVGWMAVFTAILMLSVFGTQFWQKREGEKTPYKSEEQLLQELEQEPENDSTLVDEEEKPENIQEIVQEDSETADIPTNEDEKEQEEGF